MKNFLVGVFIFLVSLPLCAQLQPEDVAELKSAYENKFVLLTYLVKLPSLHFNETGQPLDLYPGTSYGPWTETGLIHISSLVYGHHSTVLTAERIFVEKTNNGNSLVQVRTNEHVAFEIEIKTKESATRAETSQSIDKAIRINKDSLQELLVETEKWMKAPLKIRVSEIATGGPIYKVNPDFPETLKKNHKKDTIVFHVTIATDGSLKDIKTIKSVDPELDLAALNAVKLWRFKPYMMNGENVEVETNVTIDISKY